MDLKFCEDLLDCGNNKKWQKKEIIKINTHTFCCENIYDEKMAFYLLFFSHAMKGTFEEFVIRFEEIAKMEKHRSVEEGNENQEKFIFGVLKASESSTYLEPFVG